METAARLHGRPLQRLNNLARWFVRLSLVGLVVTTLLMMGWTLIRLFELDPVSILLLPFGSVVGIMGFSSLSLFVAGLGAKFLPASFGGRTHLHSLYSLLWSFWGMALAPVIGLVSGILVPVQFPYSDQLFWASQGIAWLLLFGGLVVLSWNFWKTMEPVGP